jgi:hypothetical protein
MVTGRFLHAGIDKLRNSGAVSDTETNDSSKYHYQTMSGAG